MIVLIPLNPLLPSMVKGLFMDCKDKRDHYSSFKTVAQRNAEESPANQSDTSNEPMKTKSSGGLF